MEPNLEHVEVRDDQSFKVWSHSYPFRTVRWHFHPEYELHLVTATTGSRYVGGHIGAFEPGDLVLAGPSVPHSWTSDVSEGETVAERCVVLQFTESLIARCLDTFPELRFLQPMLRDAYRGIRFGAATADAVAPLMRTLLTASGSRRIGLFVEILDRIGMRRNAPRSRARPSSRSPRLTYRPA